MRIYSCEIKCSAAALDAYLNEYHLYASCGASHSYTTNIRAWMEKENLFRVKITSSAKAKEGDPVQFSVLATVSEGDQRRNLVEMSFPAGITAPNVATLPFDTLGKGLAAGNNLAFACDDTQAVIEKPWKTNQRLITNPRDIYDLYAEIQKNFVEGDVAQLMTLSAARITFGAKLYDMRREAYEKLVRDDLDATLGKRPNWKTIQQPDQELTVHEFLPGKVMRVLDLKGNPPLRTIADQKGRQFGYDIILAMTAGGLVWIM